MRMWWTLGVGVIVLVALVACGGGGVAQPPAQPQQAAQPKAPAAAAPALEPEAPKAPAPAPKVGPKPAPPAQPAVSTPKYGGSISFSVRADPRGGFEPHIPGGRRETRQTIGMAYEMVAVWDMESGQPCSVTLKPWLAEGWKFSGDGTTVELKLRQGIKFHNKPPLNGREMTAQDVVFSYQRLFEKGLQNTLGKNVVGITAPDKYTVAIKTKQPVPLIADELLSWREAPIIAKEAGGPQGKFDTKDSLIGTGPFVLESYTPGVGLVFKRNPAYWVKGRPYLDEVRLPIMRDESTKVAALQVGKLDYMEELSSNERDRLRGRAAPLRFIPCESSGGYTIMLRNDIPPFNDVRVRRALSMAIDRESVLKGIFKGEGNLVGLAALYIEGSLKPAEFPPEARRYLQHNPAEAKRLLAEAGYPQGLDLEVFAGLHHGSPFTEQVEALPAMLRPGGFSVKLRVGDIATYQDAVSKHNYGVAGVMKSFGSFPIENLLANFYSKNDSARNRPAVRDPEYDRLVEKLTTSFDPKERAELVRRMQIRLVEQANWVSMPTFFNYHAINQRLQGELRVNEEHFRHNPGLMFREVWVD